MGRHKSRRGWKRWLLMAVLVVLISAEAAVGFTLAVVAAELAGRL